MNKLIYRCFLTPESPCEYFQDGRASRLELCLPENCTAKELYDGLSTIGFRRQGSFVYRTRCTDCTLCMPSRVPADRFRPDRTMKKILARNADLSVRYVPDAKPTEEYFALYRQYIAARHGGSSMQDFSYESFGEALFASCAATGVLEYRLKDRLLIAAIIDVMPHGLSAVYTFYSPDFPRRSLGTYSILKEIELAAARGSGQFLYLGYWIPGLKGMKYKERFRPFEIFRDGEWKEFSPEGQTESLPIQLT